VFTPENRQQQRDKNDAGTGDESGFRGRGVLQAGALEGIAAKHEKTEGDAREELFPFQIPEDARAECGHKYCGERKADGEKEEDGGVVESVLDNDKSGAPEDGAKGQREIGFGALGIFERVRRCVAQGATD
jgi:hypothetical protein